MKHERDVQGVTRQGEERSTLEKNIAITTSKRVQTLLKLHSHLSQDVMLSIFTFLHNIDDVIRSVSRVCKSWYSMIQDGEHCLFSSVIFQCGKRAWPLATQEKQTCSESEILQVINMCRNQKVNKWVMNGGIGDSIQFTEKCLKRMLELKLFEGMEVLHLNLKIPSGMDLMLEQVARQCAGSLIDISLQLEHFKEAIHPFLIHCATTLERITCPYAQFDDKCLPDQLPNVEYLSIRDASNVQSLITRCPNLKQIEWGEGDYASINTRAISLIAQHSPHFESMSLGARYLEDFELIHTITQSFPNLKELIITNGRYYDDELSAIGQQLKKLEKFVDKTEADFETYTFDNLLRDIGSTIKYLDIELPYETWSDTLKYLPELCPNLEHLFLPLPPENGREMDSKLINFFTQFPHMTTLELTTCVDDTKDMDTVEEEEEEEVEKQFRRRTVLHLVQKFGLRDDSFMMDQEPQIVEFDECSCFYIRNVHPEWMFEMTVLENDGYELRFMVTKRPLVPPRHISFRF